MTNRGEQDQSFNRRGYPRIQLKVEVTHTSEHNFFTGFTENISEGGVFIATYQSFPIGTRFELSFTLPDDPEPIGVVGEVRWIREVQTEREAIAPGVGISFVEIAPRHLERVQVFLEKREAIFWDD